MAKGYIGGGRGVRGRAGKKGYVGGGRGIREVAAAPAGGRVMGGLAGEGGIAGKGGLAGKGGGLAG